MHMLTLHIARTITIFKQTIIFKIEPAQPILSLLIVIEFNQQNFTSVRLFQMKYL